MKSFLDPEDQRLDALWRARFGQPLPIIGSASLVRRVLAESPPDPPEPRDRERSGPSIEASPTA